MFVNTDLFTRMKYIVFGLRLRSPVVLTVLGTHEKFKREMQVHFL